MHYFVDGYNLLFRSEHSTHGLQQQRENVVAYLLERVTVLELNVTLVFDSAYTPGLSTRQHMGRLEIVYSSAGETADAYIIGEVLLSKARQRETIITSDKQLAEHARRLGAKTMNVESFCAWLQARYLRRRGKFHNKALAVFTPLPLAKAEKKMIPPPICQTPKQLVSGPDHYLQIFEERFNGITENDSPKLSKTVHHELPKRRPRKRQAQARKEAPETDSDRWLRLFLAGNKEDENC